MKRLRNHLISMSCLFITVLCSGADDVKNGAFQYDPADEIVKSSLLDNPEYYDADMAADGDSVWLAWLQFEPGKGDHVWVGQKHNDKWIVKQQATSIHGRYANPTITIDKNNRIWLSYEAEKNAQWDIFITYLQADGKLAAMRQITSGPGPDIHHRTARHRSDGIWVVWQSGQRGQFDILISHIQSSDKHDVSVVSDKSPCSDWHPDLAVASNGTLWVAWDAYDGTSYNVYARRYHEKSWDDPVTIAASPAFEGRVSMAPDQQGNVWISWEEGARNWGMPYRSYLHCYPKRFTIIADDRGPLHRFRLLRLAMLGTNDKLSYPKFQLPMPSIDQAMKRPDAPEGVAALGAFYERGKLVVDGHNRLWCIYRHYYAPWMGIGNTHHVEQGWGVYARYLDGTGWSKVYRFDTRQGDGMQRLEVTPDLDGMAAVWTTGRTDRRMNNSRRSRGIAMGKIKLSEKKPAKTARILTSKQIRREGPIFPYDSGRPPSQEVTLAGSTYKLFFGDLHRHTDLSLCDVAGDGTIDDAYRYAIDVAQLDFMGITDHSRDLAKGNALSQLWWRNIKEVLRHELTPNFFPFYAFERSRPAEDHNVISLRSDILRPYTYPHSEYWEELNDDSFMIPHQTAGIRFPKTLPPALFITLNTWDVINNKRRPLLEIYQGCRDRSIEADAHEGLARGHRFGFIASSDHGSTGASFAGVWAEKPDRETIFRAMQTRRTFGATDKIGLLVQAGEHWMGEVISDNSLPMIHVQADGTASIQSIEVMIDGLVHHTLHPDQRHIQFDYQTKNLNPGKHYLYIRLKQNDGNTAWSSPIWFHTQ